MSNEPCCGLCAGSAPYFICRDKHKCLCHAYLDLMAQKKHKASGHRDPTASTAVGNVLKGQKR